MFSRKFMVKAVVKPTATISDMDALYTALRKYGVDTNDSSTYSFKLTRNGGYIIIRGLISQQTDAVIRALWHKSVLITYIEETEQDGETFAVLYSDEKGRFNLSEFVYRFERYIEGIPMEEESEEEND